jgi:hypothetical protein
MYQVEELIVDVVHKDHLPASLGPQRADAKTRPARSPPPN